MELALNNRTALVTGSYRGTGAVIAKTLLGEGARVFVHGLEPGQAEAALSDIGGGEPVTGDIRTDAGAQQVVDALQSEHIEILVNNYGTTVPGTWLEADTAAWLDAYQINVLSAQRLVRALLPAMVNAGWGRIINLGTIGSTRPNAAMPHYYASKGALANLTVGLAKEVAGTGVRVNLVSPGLIATPEVKAAFIARGAKKGWGDTWEAVEPHVAKDIPIRRVTTREEVANLVAFLASPVADAIHGQNLRIDGGSVDVVT